MSDSVMKEIDKTYEDIMKVIVGSTLYGIPVTDNNVKLLIVASYFYGMFGDIDNEENKWENMD